MNARFYEVGMRLFLCLVLIVAFGSLGASAQQKAVPRSQEDLQFSYAPLVRQTAPAVVNVYAQKRVAARRQGGLFDDPFFRQFFGDENRQGPKRQRLANSLGSGVIVDASGLVVTNNHVIAGADDIRVVLADKREFEAKLLLADERTDLAVLRIDTKDEELPFLSMADSDNLEVGDIVLAIGNPFGVGQTVTSGIVSALARTQVGITDYQFFIQTDAAINPGNSGGALVDMKGELVGINTAIFSRSGGSIGIGFSIPTNMVRTVVKTAASGKALKRPWLGAEFQDLTPDLAASLGFERPVGAIVTRVIDGGPLAKAGLRRGDVIVAIDDRPLENAKELGYHIATSQIGDNRIFDYQRGSKRNEVRVVMAEPPETVPREELQISGRSPLTGMLVANLSPAVTEEMNMSTDLTGVVVTKSEQGPALRFFRRGDRIVSINDKEIDSVATLIAIIEDSPPYWDIQIERRGRAVRLRLR
jgi:Do/DeqQ family serine protease